MNSSSLQKSFISDGIETEIEIDMAQMESLNKVQQLNDSFQRKPSRRELLEEWKK